MKSRLRLAVPISLAGLALVVGGCSFLGSADDDARSDDSTTSQPAPTQSEAESNTDEGSDSIAVDPESSTSTTEVVVPEPDDGDLFELLTPTDRIVVQSADNNLSILTFAGELPGPTSSDANQPVFSPDGSVLAWSRLNPQGGGELVLADVGDDGSLTGETIISTPVLSFYSVFAPASSDRIAVLGNARRGVGVAVVDRSTGSSEVLDEGVPYYFVWDGEGSGFLGHVGTSLRTFDIDSATGISGIDVLPSFRAPALMGDGSVVYVTTENLDGSAGFSSIARIEAVDGVFDGTRQRSVARFDGLGSLSLSPDSSQLAVIVEGALNDARVFNASSHAAGFQSDQALDRGLHLIDTETDEIRTIASTPVLGAFWSPDSEFLAVFAPDSVGDGRAWARWTVYDTEGEILSRTPRLLPSPIFTTAYLPFYDQFEQSVTPWSPDSTRLVIAGESAAGETGIWLHKTPMAGDDAQTFRVGDGVMAVWSP